MGTYDVVCRVISRNLYVDLLTKGMHLILAGIIGFIMLIHADNT